MVVNSCSSQCSLRPAIQAHYISNSLAMGPVRETLSILSRIYRELILSVGFQSSGPARTHGIYDLAHSRLKPSPTLLMYLLPWQFNDFEVSYYSISSSTSMTLIMSFLNRGWSYSFGQGPL